MFVSFKIVILEIFVQQKQTNKQTKFISIRNQSNHPHLVTGTGCNPIHSTCVPEVKHFFPQF